MEEGELPVDVESATDKIKRNWIPEKTKRKINRAMGKDNSHQCQECDHQASSLRRHKEHIRGHQFMVHLSLWYDLPDKRGDKTPPAAKYQMRKSKCFMYRRFHLHN